MMKNAAFCMDGLSLHSYTLCGDTWDKKGSATDFTTEEYYKTLCRASRMDGRIARHSAIMDRYSTDSSFRLPSFSFPPTKPP